MDYKITYECKANPNFNYRTRLHVNVSYALGIIFIFAAFYMITRHVFSNTVLLLTSIITIALTIVLTLIESTYAQSVRHTLTLNNNKIEVVCDYDIMFKDKLEKATTITEFEYTDIHNINAWNAPYIEIIGKPIVKTIINNIVTYENNYKSSKSPIVVHVETPNSQLHRIICDIKDRSSNYYR